MLSSIVSLNERIFTWLVKRKASRLLQDAGLGGIFIASQRSTAAISRRRGKLGRFWSAVATEMCRQSQRELIVADILAPSGSPRQAQDLSYTLSPAPLRDAGYLAQPLPQSFAPARRPGHVPPPSFGQRKAPRL